MCNLRYFILYARLIAILAILSFSIPAFSQQKARVNLMENLKPVGMPVEKFEGEPLARLTGHNYKLAAFSNDLKYMAVSRSYLRKGSEVMDIVLVKLKNLKEAILLDTLTMIRYGRPNGLLYGLYFDDQQNLVAKISDGMEGSSTLIFDTEKRELIKDEYQESDIEEYEDEGDEDIYYETKLKDLKRLFPNKTNILLSELVYKLREIDSVGYFTQGILPNNNSIFFLPQGQGKLKLIHDISDPKQNDNIEGVWGNKEKAFYLLKDKKNNYFFRYDIKANVVTLLEKYPVHSHFSYIYDYPLKNKDVLLSFEIEQNKQDIDETLKLFRLSNGILYKIDDYPYLVEVKYIEAQNLLLLFYLKDGKRCLDVRNLTK